MDQKFTWTVDVETDYGGRTNTIEGIKEGLPLIFETFRSHGVQGLFFVSTELLDIDGGIIKTIQNQGHQIGSHGHFHTRIKEDFRRQADKRLSLLRLGREDVHYRAPKFSFVTPDIYSNPKNHVGLLKKMWLNIPIPKDPIFYLHPFDLVGGKDYPDLFCRVWYSRPKQACKVFKNLVSSYPGGVYTQ